jgi:spore photoproduct lyase
VELITHRFTPGSKSVLTGWYPGSTLTWMRQRGRVRRLSSIRSSTCTRPMS